MFTSKKLTSKRSVVGSFPLCMNRTRISSHRPSGSQTRSEPAVTPWNRRRCRGDLRLRVVPSSHSLRSSPYTHCKSLLSSLHLAPIPCLAARPDDRCCLFALPAGHGQEGAARVDTRVDAGGVARCAWGARTGDRKSRSVLVCMMRGAALAGAHCGSHCHIAWRLPIFASSRSLSHPDASPFFAARLDTAPDALCGSVCRLSSSGTAPPPHAAFPHVPTAHRARSTGWASMGNYIFDPQTLLEAMRADAAKPDSAHDFGQNIIPELVCTGKLYAYDFNQNRIPGSFLREELAYWRDAGTLDTYYEANLDLKNVQPQLNLYNWKWPILTAFFNDPPAKFVFDEAGRRGNAVQSIVSPGCILAGGFAKDSVLGRNVFLDAGCEVH